MGLLTGTPQGTIVSQEEVYIEGAPYIYYQDYSATELNHPDSEGYYWGLSGTATYPVYALGCYSDVTLGEALTMNVVRCDNVGDKSIVQKRDHLELNLTIQTMFPLTSLSPLIKASAPTVNASANTEKMGIGQINNNTFYHFYLPKVYDEDTGDYLIMQLHKAKIVDAFSLAMTSGDNWKLSGIKIYAFADDTKPSAQSFATVVRWDASAL